MLKNGQIYISIKQIKVLKYFIQKLRKGRFK